MEKADILLIEDEPSIREVVTLYLERAGYQVRSIADGNLAVKELERDIRLFLDGRAVSAKQDSLWESLVKLIRRNKAVSAAVASSRAPICEQATPIAYRLKAS